MEAKLKHLEFIQAVIARMGTNSFLFKGWAITIAAALSGFAAVNNKEALLGMALISSLLFWGLDGYYLWLERSFVHLHEQVSKMSEAEIDFKMAPDKTNAFRKWLCTCVGRPHLCLFYASITVFETVGIFVIKAVPRSH